MNLEFTQKKISEVLKNVFVTISFSSTVIEDSLYSNIPVILFDRWKRYKHCNSEENINFNEHIFSGNSKKNINSLISKLL